MLLGEELRVAQNQRGRPGERLNHRLIVGSKARLWPAVHQSQDADQLVLHQQRHADIGPKRLVGELRQPVRVLLIVVEDQRRAGEDDLARQPLAGRQAHASMVAAEAVANQQLQIPVFVSGPDRGALRTAQDHRALADRAQHRTEVGLAEKVEA